jgi:DNA-binding transcriptional MerR regulator
MTAEVKKQYTVGQVSQITGISSRMLRYYERRGLLQPFFRNPQNNYRCYSETQLEELLLIKELSRIGFATDDLMRIFHDCNLSSLEKELESKIAAAAKDIQSTLRRYFHMSELCMRVQKSLRTVEWMRENPSIATIKLTTISSQHMVFIRYHGLFNSRDIFMEKVAELYRLIKQHSFPTLDPFFVIFHQQYAPSFTAASSDSELCIPLEHAVDSPHTRYFEECRALFFLQVGSYSRLESTYAKLEGWEAEHRLKTTGTAIEEYIVSPTMTSADENFVTQIYLLLDDARRSRGGRTPARDSPLRRSHPDRGPSCCVSL